MVRLVKISLFELPKQVEVAYEGDKDLFEKYHVMPNMELGECVVSTMAMVLQEKETNDLQYYKVIYQKKAIGYVIKYGNVLFSYGLNVKYRKPEILSNWWKEIKTIMKGRFVTSLFKNNTRTIDHLLRNKFKVLAESSEYNTITLVHE